jgi:hypothetical protein
MQWKYCIFVIKDSKRYIFAVDMLKVHTVTNYEMIMLKKHKNKSTKSCKNIDNIILALFYTQ